MRIEHNLYSMLHNTPKMKHVLRHHDYNIKESISKSQHEKKNAVKSCVIFSFNTEIPQDLF